MSEVVYLESCHAWLLCTALNLGNSSGSSLSVGVYRIKLNNLIKNVELLAGAASIPAVSTNNSSPHCSPRLIDCLRQLPRSSGGSCGSLRTSSFDYTTRSGSHSTLPESLFSPAALARLTNKSGFSEYHKTGGT